MSFKKNTGRLLGGAEPDALADVRNFPMEVIGEALKQLEGLIFKDFGCADADKGMVEIAKTIKSSVLAGIYHELMAVKKTRLLTPFSVGSAVVAHGTVSADLDSSQKRVVVSVVDKEKDVHVKTLMGFPATGPQVDTLVDQVTAEFDADLFKSCVLVASHVRVTNGIVNVPTIPQNYKFVDLTRYYKYGAQTFPLAMRDILTHHVGFEPRDSLKGAELADSIYAGCQRSDSGGAFIADVKESAETHLKCGFMKTAIPVAIPCIGEGSNPIDWSVEGDYNRKFGLAYGVLCECRGARGGDNKDMTLHGASSALPLVVSRLHAKRIYTMDFLYRIMEKNPKLVAAGLSIMNPPTLIFDVLRMLSNMLNALNCTRIYVDGAHNCPGVKLENKRYHIPHFELLVDQQILPEGLVINFSSVELVSCEPSKVYEVYTSIINDTLINKYEVRLGAAIESNYGFIPYQSPHNLRGWHCGHGVVVPNFSFTNYYYCSIISNLTRNFSFASMISPYANLVVNKYCGVIRSHLASSLFKVTQEYHSRELDDMASPDDFEEAERAMPQLKARRDAIKFDVVSQIMTAPDKKLPVVQSAPKPLVSAVIQTDFDDFSGDLLLGSSKIDKDKQIAVAKPSNVVSSVGTSGGVVIVTTTSTGTAPVPLENKMSVPLPTSTLTKKQRKRMKNKADSKTNSGSDN